MKRTKRSMTTLFLALLLIAALALSACGGGSKPAATEGAAATTAATVAATETTPAAQDPAAETTAAQDATSAAPGGETVAADFPTADAPAAGERVSAKDKPVVVINAPLPKIELPLLVTSVGQSADISMLDALLKKIGADYEFKATATADDLGSARTVLIAAGASSKGLGAAGISADDEKARAEKLITACKEKGVTVILAHLGGASRRGPLSDEFVNLILDNSSALLVVEDGNEDAKFSTFASEKKIPLILVNAIADCVAPLSAMLGK